MLGKETDMKAKIVLALILSGMLCLSGCKDSKTAEQKQNETAEDNKGKEKVQAYRTPTEQEMEILEGCNLSKDYMKEIKEKGMSLSVQSFVDTAQIMLDYLEEKYEEEFEVVGGEIPGIISGDYMIFAKATTGDYIGKRFEVYYRVDEEGKGYCEDGYFAILKNNEFQQMMQERADETGEGWKVFTELNGMYGKEYEKDTQILEIESEMIHGDVNCIMTPEKSEEEYVEALEKLRKEYGKDKYNIHIYYCQFLHLEDWERVYNYNVSNEVMREETEENPIYTGVVFE